MKKKHGSSKIFVTLLFQSSANYSILCREKNLLISGDNYGRDLPSVQNLQKKQQHFESELEGHEAKVQQLQSTGHGLEVVVVTAAAEIKERCGRLQKLWMELSNASDKRYIATQAYSI